MAGKPLFLKRNLFFKTNIFGIALFTLAINGCVTPPPVEQVIKLEGKPNTECELLAGSKNLGVFTVPSTLIVGGEVRDIKAICTVNETKVTNIIAVPELSDEEKIVVKGSQPTQLIDSTSIRIVVK